MILHSAAVTCSLSLYLLLLLLCLLFSWKSQVILMRFNCTSRSCRMRQKVHNEICEDSLGVHFPVPADYVFSHIPSREGEERGISVREMGGRYLDLCHLQTKVTTAVAHREWLTAFISSDALRPCFGQKGCACIFASLYPAKEFPMREA